jgi:cytochrome P450
MIDGHFIPSGYDVGTCIYSIHHNADYYPDPFMYRPERWLEAGSTELARSAFNPFSVGPRGCIGKGLANTELMLTMAFMLSKFDFRRADGALGGGSPGAEYGRHRETEYQLYDHVTAAKDGPWIQVCKRV